MRQIDESLSQSVFETQGLKSMTIPLPGSSFHNRQPFKVKFFNVAMMVDHKIEMCGSLISNDFFLDTGTGGWDMKSSRESFKFSDVFAYELRRYCILRDFCI